MESAKGAARTVQRVKDNCAALRFARVTKNEEKTNMKLMICMIAAGSLFIASAQDKKKSTGVLHPELTVGKDAGTHTAPMGKIGDKGEVWTGTTMAAGVDGKPQPGKTVTVVGEIVDMSCYLQLGKHGEKHPCRVSRRGFTYPPSRSPQ
jgi:hypothetical protein